MSGPILVDVDGVLIDWITPFHKWMEQDRGFVRKPSRAYDLNSHYGTEVGHMVELFNESPAFRTLEVASDAYAGMYRLRSIYPERTIVAVSCCGDRQRQVSNRQYQLRDLPLNGLITLPLGAAKEPVFAQFRPGTVIEDSPRHLDEAMACGHFAVCVDRPWNQEQGGHYRVRDWASMRMEDLP